MNDGVLGERAGAQRVPKGFAPRSRQRSALVDRIRRRAIGVLPANTGAAGPTGPDQRDDHWVADRDVLDTGADRFDVTGGLVAEHGWEISAPTTVGHDDVGMTDGGGLHRDTHLTGSGRGHGDRLDAERFAEPTTHGGTGAHRRGHGREQYLRSASRNRSPTDETVRVPNLGPIRSLALGEGCRQE